MKTINTISKMISTRMRKTNTATAPQCNFQDNYYGDRICVLPSRK